MNTESMGWINIFGLLILAYWIFWVLFFIRTSISKRMALAIIPTLLFLLSGITMGYWLLVAAGVLFGASHIYVTCQNRLNEESMKNDI